MTFRVLFWDVDGTLLNFQLGARNAMKCAMDAFGLSYCEEMYPVFEEINNALWHRIEQGTLTHEHLLEIRWKMIFDRLGVSAADPLSFEKFFLRFLSEKVFPFPHAAETLDALSKRYTLCVASNANEQEQRRRLMLAGLDRYFAHIFTSGMLGVQKPSPLFFEKCLSLLGGVSRDEAVMIGDSLSADIAGGSAAGLKTVWVNFNDSPPSEGIHPDWTVTSLSEIVALF